MKICLYGKHTHLPLRGNNDCKPNILFDPQQMSKWKIEKDRYNKYSIPLVDHWFYQLLMGLSGLTTPNMLANISMNINFAQKKLGMQGCYFWTIITSMPQETDESGLPLVMIDKKLNVDHIWGEEHYATHLSNLPNIPSRTTDAEIWEEYFMQLLKSTKQATLLAAQKQLDQAKIHLRVQKQLFEGVPGAISQ